MLPSRSYSICIPPYANDSSIRVEVLSENISILEGRYNISPAGPMMTLAENDTEIVSWGEGKVIRDGKNINVYEADADYPEKPVSSFPVSQMRKWKYVPVIFTAFKYNPVSKSLALVKDVTVKISYIQDNATAWLAISQVDTVLDDIAPGAFYNYNEIKQLYQSPSGAAQETSAAKNDYVIITTNQIKSNSAKLTDFVSHKKSLGHTVLVVTESNFNGLTGQYPNHRAEKIRKWLINNYKSLGIKYVLLIGDPRPYNNGEVGDIPMQICWPNKASSTPTDPTPTDCFYSDLTGNWDRDGDGYFGELNDDYPVTGGVDFGPEVYVGRIPVYNQDYSALDRILQKTIDYECGGSMEWRKSALFPMSFIAQDVDGAVLSERIKDDCLIPNGYSYWRMYQQGSGKCGTHSSYASEEEIKAGTCVRDRWASNGYGIVCWVGHGGDIVAQLGYGDCVDGWFFESKNCSGLDDDYPSFTYQGSCNNGYPETPDNLQYSLLKQGGISTVAATRPSWFGAETYDNIIRSNSIFGIGYEYVKRLTQGLACGDSLYQVKMNNPRPEGNGWLQNYYDFNIYGDPSAALKCYPSTKTYWGFNESFEEWDRLGTAPPWEDYTIKQSVSWHGQWGGDQGVIVMDACDMPSYNTNASGGIGNVVRLPSDASVLEVGLSKALMDGKASIYLTDSGGVEHLLGDQILSGDGKAAADFSISRWAGQVVTLVIRAYGACTSGSCDPGNCCCNFEYMGVDYVRIAKANLTVTKGNGATSVTTNSARLNGQVTYTGNRYPEVRFYWGVKDGAVDPAKWGHNESLGTLSQAAVYKDLSGLTPGTTYYYRCYAKNSLGGVWASSTAKFKTNRAPGTPSVPAGSKAGLTGGPYSYSTSSKDPDGDKVLYTFDWGDGAISSTSLVKSGSKTSASHIWSVPGTYNVTARATDSKGEPSGWSGPLSVKIDLNSAPAKPSMPKGPGTGREGDSYSYSTSAKDPNGDKVLYTFDWGDGTKSNTSLVSSGTASAISHIWAAAGNYSVTARATDSRGASSGWSDALAVTVKPNNPPATPSVPAGSRSGSTGIAYSYSTSSKDPDGDNVKYTFDWDDGNTTDTKLVSSGSKSSASHIWTVPGSYNVKAMAADKKGATSAWSAPLTVIVTTRPPAKPSAISGPSSGYTGVSYNFSTSSKDPDKDKIKYAFEWGDGTSYEVGYLSSGSKVIAPHSWGVAKTYSIRAKATDINGAGSEWSTSKSVKISSPRYRNSMAVASVENSADPAGINAQDASTSDPSLLYSQGEALLDQGKYNDSLQSFDGALSLNPELAPAWNGKGVALAIIGRLNESNQSYARALELDPGYVDAWYNKGLVLYDLGRYNESIECFDKAIGLDPGDDVSWYEKGESLLALGNETGSQAAFSKAAELGFA